MTVHVQRASRCQRDDSIPPLEARLFRYEANHDHGSAGEVVAEREAMLQAVVLDTLVGSEDSSCQACANRKRLQLVVL